MIARPRAVLFDFGDTLAREPFFRTPPAGETDWPARLARAMDIELTDRWGVGELCWEHVLAALAERLGVAVARLRPVLEGDCRRLRLNRGVLSFAERLARRRFPIALVTVNPDLFSAVIAPRYRLAERFGVIVTSWEQRTLDKMALCGEALRRLGPGHAIGTTLLIDNLDQHVQAFRRLGGAAYRFTTDARFAIDLAKDPSLAVLQND